MNTTQDAPVQTGQPQYKITEADKARQKAIERAWVAYNGQLEPPLDPMPDGRDPNVMSNRCIQIVNAGVDFLFGKEIEISVEDGAPQEAQDVLDTVWGRKETRLPLLQKLAMNGAMAGTAFLRIVPNQDGDEFRLIVLDPSTVFVQTAPQDCETVLLYCIQYCTDEKNGSQDVKVYYREEIMRIDPDGNARKDMPDDDDTWSIQHWTMIVSAGQDPDKGTWAPAGDPIPWPYEFAPIFACQNLPLPNSFWGQPDITPDLIAMNEALNFVQSNINSVNMIYGAPILWSTGMGQGMMEIPIGRIIGAGHPDAKIASVPITSDMANALSFAANIRSDMDEQSSVPSVATGRISELPKGNVSGVALELLFMPLLKRTDKKQCLYGELLIDVSKALLILSKMSEDIDITLAWQSPIPHDDLQSAQYAVTLKSLGISDTTLQRNLGFDPDEEMALSQAEDAQKLVAFSRGQAMPPMPPNQQPPAQDQQEGGYQQ